MVGCETKEKGGGILFVYCDCSASRGARGASALARNSISERNWPGWQTGPNSAYTYLCPQSVKGSSCNKRKMSFLREEAGSEQCDRNPIIVIKRSPRSLWPLRSRNKLWKEDVEPFSLARNKLSPTVIPEIHTSWDAESFAGICGCWPASRQTSRRASWSSANDDERDEAHYEDPHLYPTPSAPCKAEFPVARHPSFRNSVAWVSVVTSPLRPPIDYICIRRLPTDLFRLIESDWSSGRRPKIVNLFPFRN